jgi:SAM-dependent methyltransferase
MLQPPILEKTSCPLCECSRSSRVLEAVDNLCGIPGVYYADRCEDCGHLYMNPRPTAATLHRCYPDSYGPHLASPPDIDKPDVCVTPERPWYLRYLPLRYVPGLKPLYHWLTDDFSQPLPPKPATTASSENPRAFELGCSTGGYLSRLAADGWDVVGVEPSESASEKARASGLTVHTGVLDFVSLPEASFDSAAAWMVIEHVLYPLTTLRQIHRLLKPGGTLLISIPNTGCWEPRVFRSAWYVWELPRHLQFYTPRSIRNVLESAGFNNVRVSHQRNVLNIIGSSGILLRRFSLTRRLGDRLLRYPDSPNMWIQLIISPIARLLSLIRQGGRLTIMAERPHESSQS